MLCTVSGLSRGQGRRIQNAGGGPETPDSGHRPVASQTPWGTHGDQGTPRLDEFEGFVEETGFRSDLAADSLITK